MAAFMVLGRGHLLKTGIAEVIDRKSEFSKNTYTMQEKIVATTKVFQTSLIAIPSSTEVKEHMYWWENLESKISITEIGIILVTAIGAIVNRKELFVKISAIWSVFAFGLFVVLNWSVKETPLFTIYFSWAIIPLFVMGMDFIIEKMKMKPQIIYGIIMIFMMVINAITMFDIQNYLTTF